MKRVVPLLVLLLAGCTSSVTIVHFTDYHSHATPFYVRGERDAAGIARAFAYVEPLSMRDDVVVLNGGDTMNLGAPVWSDKYRCVEWPWWNGVVDAMAWGNHDADYGPQEFRSCQASVDYPILGGNVWDEHGDRLFLHYGHPYMVLERRGRRIGLFALAGSDFPSLLKPATSPAKDLKFTDRVTEAREIVRALREDERVDAVILFGHAHNEEDEILAKAVPGIDLILGTHSHKATPLKRIDGTTTWMIASGQYLEFVSRVEMEFSGKTLRGISGELVPMTAEMPEEPQITEKVSRLEAELVADPVYATLFEPVGRVAVDLSNDGVNEGPTAFGRFVMDAVRQAAGADVALSTSSSFRGGLPAGTVSESGLLEVLPYDNAVLVYQMTRDELEALLTRARELRGSDSFVQLSGIAIDETPGEKEAWTVATTDYLARVSPQWKELFAGKTPKASGLGVRAIVRGALAN